MEIGEIKQRAKARLEQAGIVVRQVKYVWSSGKQFQLDFYLSCKGEPYAKKQFRIVDEHIDKIIDIYGSTVEREDGAIESICHAGDDLSGMKVKAPRIGDSYRFWICVEFDLENFLAIEQAS